MNGFFEQFREFALGMWSDEGGIVSRSEATPKVHSNRTSGAAGPKNFGNGRRAISFLGAMGVSIGMAVSLPAGAMSSPWEQISAAGVIQADYDTVPPGYWRGAVEQLRARIPVDETMYVDIDSIF